MRVRSNEGKLTVKSSPWFFVPKPNPKADLRLFCFPYAGGMAEIYYSWINDLPDNIELVAIQYPGHVPGTCEKLYTRLTHLAEDLVKEIEQLDDKKYVFFGHSMGVLVAYELAQKILQSKMRNPEYLFFAARNPPHLPIVQPLIHNMTDDEIIQVARAFNALPEEVLRNQELLKVIIPILKADFEMIGTWNHDPDAEALDIPICAFSGVNDSLGLPKNMAEWNKYTKKDFRIIKVPEQHYFILNKDVRKDVIDIIVKQTG